MSAEILALDHVPGVPELGLHLRQLLWRQRRQQVRHPLGVLLKLLPQRALHYYRLWGRPTQLLPEHWSPENVLPARPLLYLAL